MFEASQAESCKIAYASVSRKIHKIGKKRNILQISTFKNILPYPGYAIFTTLVRRIQSRFSIRRQRSGSEPSLHFFLDEI